MKYPERVLVVLNQDGTFKAAHMEQLEIDENGKPVRLHGAEAITAAALTSIMPDTALLLVQVDALRRRCVELEARLAGKGHNA